MAREMERANYTQLEDVPDAEANVPEMLEQEEEEEYDEDYLEMDEEEEAQDEKKIGSWKEQLRKLSQTSVPEESLHDVPWVIVIKHFLLNLGAFILFVAFMLVTRAPAPVALVQFLLTFGLLVILEECLVSCRIQMQIVIILVIASCLIAGMIFFGPLTVAMLLAQWSFVPMGLMVLVLWCCEKPWVFRRLCLTEAYQAFTGEKYVRLASQLDLATFFKSIQHSAEQPPTLFRGIIARFTSCMLKTGVWRRKWAVPIRMVAVEEKDPEISDTTLVLGDEEIEPDKYLFVRMFRNRKDENTGEGTGVVDEFDADKLADILKQTKLLSDAKLNTMISPNQPQAPETGGAADDKAKRTTAIRLWLEKSKFPPDGSDELVLCLRRQDYLDGLFKHWAPRAMLNIAWLAILAFPTIKLMMEFEEQRRLLCGEDGNLDGPLKLGSAELCGNEDGMPCKDACGSLLKWVQTVHDAMHISHIELFLTYMMLPIFLFMSSVASAQRHHNKRELIYLRGLQAPQKAISEVLKMKDSLEHVFKLSTLLARAATAFRAWMGADPALTACGPITDAEFDLTSTKAANECFKQVMQPISSLTSSISCAATGILLYGVGGEEEVAEEVASEWKMLKMNNSLAGSAGRNFKVMMDLQMYTQDSWELFRKWCTTKYKKQLLYSTSPEHPNAQDDGSNTHLEHRELIHDIVMPKGFSLTHIYVQAMPGDGLPFQIEVSDIKPKQGETDLQPFSRVCDSIEHALKTATDDEEDQPTADEWKEFLKDQGKQSKLDYRLGEHPIVARFALSEQYYINMNSEEIKALLEGEGHAGTDSVNGFAEFADALLVPQEFVVPESEEGRSYLFLTAISVFMGDEVPLEALLAAIRSCLDSMRVYLQCACLAMVIPIMRRLAGLQFFPAPFSLWLILITASVWYQLVTFFSQFHSAKLRLQIITECLGIFQQKSLAPGTAAATKKKEEQKGQQAEQTDKEKKTTENNPFDLVVEDCMVGSEYHPAKEEWQKAWQTKHANVKHWHATAAYLRVFVSTSRLVSQAILGAAAVLLGLLLIMSIVQAVSSNGIAGKAISELHHANVGKGLEKAADVGQATRRRLQEEFEEALGRLAKDRASSRRMAGIAHATEEPIAETLTATARQLRTAVVPLRASLLHALGQQERVLLEGQERLRRYRSAPTVAMDTVASAVRERRLAESKAQQMLNAAAKLDVTKVTQTQVFTIAMVLFVLLYSVPLMWNIVKVNEYFDKHEDILVKQKERHRVSQARREVKAKPPPPADSGDQTGNEEAGGAAAAGTAETGAENAAGTATNVAGAGIAETGAENAAGAATEKQGVAADPWSKRCEKLLNTAAESSKKSRERFPLKLFGFVISAQLLVTWVGLAISPIMSQAKQMVPTLVMQGCTYIEHSKMIDNLQQQIDKTNPDLQINVHDLIHQNVCAPLTSALTQQLSQKIDSAGEQLKTQVDSKIRDSAQRRLQSINTSPTIQAIHPADWAMPAGLLEAHVPRSGEQSWHLEFELHAWWHEHPEHHPELKFAMAQLVLGELSREADQLLLRVPRSVAAAWSVDGGSEEAFKATLATVQPYLKEAVAELEAWAPVQWSGVARSAHRSTIMGGASSGIDGASPTSK